MGTEAIFDEGWIVATTSGDSIKVIGYSSSYAYAKPPKPRRPAQVYSVRIPPDRLEELHKVAARQGVTVGTLIRAWVLERLDKEKDLSPEMTLLKAAIVAAVVEALEVPELMVAR